jgi:imidazolonepropionase-like amidohydrolase
MRARGVTVSLSTDSAPSLRAELAVSREANQRLYGTHLSARQLLELATLGSARCLGRDDEIGHLGVGAVADIVVWPLPEAPLEHTPDAVLEGWLAAGPKPPRHTIIQGRCVVDNGQLVNEHYADRKDRHDRITAQWQQVVDGN